MRGVLEAPVRLFYDLYLEAQIPGNHMLCQIDRFLDVGTMRAALKPHYSHFGRPLINPELIVRMLVIGLHFGHPPGTAAV